MGALTRSRDEAECHLARYYAGDFPPEQAIARRRQAPPRAGGYGNGRPNVLTRNTAICSRVTDEAGQ
jgi:hypothetical protein